MDKFEHEKHNRRERVYKYPRINLWIDSKQASSNLRKQSKKETQEYKCLEVYRDFFRNPRNHEYVSEPLKSRKFMKFGPELQEQLKIGAKVFGKIEVGSKKYMEFITPREFLYWDDSNREMYESYRAAIESLRKTDEIQKNQNILNALRRNRFESD